MKIAQVCPYNIYRSGGVQSHILFLAENLRRRKHDVKILAPKINGGKIDTDLIEKIAPDVEIVQFGTGKLVSMQETQMEITFEPRRNKIKEYLENEKFDVMHFHTPETPFLSLQILSDSNCATIATHHSTYPETMSAKALEKMWSPLLSYILDAFDTTIAVSDVPARPLKEKTSKEVLIVPNGIDLRTFNHKVKGQKGLRHAKDEVIILFLGRLDKRKGVIYLIKAFEKLRKTTPNARLLIAGKGTELENLKSYVKRKKLSDVEFLGFIPEEEKPSLYASCDIYCSPAIYGESFGIVLVEAMATGKPVVSTAIPGHKSAIKDRGRLLLAQPKDINDLAEKLEILCKYKDLRKSFGKWGVEAAQEFSWDRITERLIEIYEETLDRRNQKPESPPKEFFDTKIFEKLLKKLKINNPFG